MEIKKVNSTNQSKKSNTSKNKKIVTVSKNAKPKVATKRPNNNKPIGLTKTTTNKKKKKRSGKILNGILSLLMFLGIVIMIAIMAFSGYIVMSAPEFDTDLLYSNEASIFYDKNGNEFARVGTEQRELVYYDDLPQVLVDAIVATEDSRYFQHNGFDVVRFAKASFGQLTGQSGAGGASTLTMQVVKNTFTSTTASGIKGIIRKFTDIYMSIFLVEKNYTKEEIMEFYVNDPYLGASSWGVEQASQNYFGKSVRDLTLAEASLLAGVFNAPGAYDPFVYPDLATQRRSIVLNLMVRHGYITQEQAEDAKAISVESLLIEKSASQLNKYQAFIDVVCEEIQEKYGEEIDPYLIPMEVYTTMDPNIQDVMIKLNAGELGYKWKTYKYNDYSDNIQIGAVITDVKDGSIAAVNGGRHQTTPKAYSRAIHMKTQPGSIAKPIFAYGPYLEYNNGNTGTLFFDNKMTYSNGQQLKNDDNTYMGAITMRTALVKSRNIPAVQAFQAVDKNKISEFVHNCGLSYGNTLYEAHAIGGGLQFSPEDMAGAYGTFARGGYYIKPYSFTKVIFRETDEVREEKYEKVQAMSAETAYMITDMLITATKNNVGGNIKVSGTEVASKTGTSTYNSAALKANKVPSSASADNWVITYSPDYVISFWYGVDKLGPKQYTDSLAAAIERKKISAQLANNIYKKNSKFKKPSSVISAKYEEETNPAQLPSEYTPESLISTELFKKGTEPSEVSDRFTALSNPTNGSAEVSNAQINLSWNEIKNPNAISETYLQNYFSENYGQFASIYLKKRIEYNTKNIGTLGYQVYLNTDAGQQYLGWTANPYYVYTAASPGIYTFTVKSSYSIFKNNASKGITITADVSTGSIPSLPEEDPNNGEIITPEEDHPIENPPVGVEVTQ